MAGRNDRSIVVALEVIAQELQGQQKHVDEELCGLDKFLRNKSATFKGRYDLEGAHG